MFELPIFITSLASIPMFSSRTFGAMFWVAAAARLHAEGFFRFVENLGPLRFSAELHFPSWLIDDRTLSVLLVLTLVELWADKNPEIRSMLSELDPTIKAAGDLIFQNVALVGSLALVASSGLRHAGLGDAAWTLVPAAAVFLVAGLRRNVLSFLTELDEDDDLGVRKLISWAEDGWVGASAFLVVLMPVVALAVAGATCAALGLVQLWMRHRERRLMVTCHGCDDRILPSALTCHHCRRPVDHPVTVGVLGQPTRHPVTDLDAHRLRLLSKKRCLVCATRLSSKALRQACPCCDAEMLPSREWAERYLEYVHGKLPKTLLVCFGFSLVPVFGLIPGVIYYRLGLISALRTYVPPTMGCMTRWIVRLSNLLLLAFQWVPIFGALTLPAMCALNYALYRRVLVHQKEAHFPLRKATAETP